MSYVSREIHTRRVVAPFVLLYVVIVTLPRQSVDKSVGARHTKLLYSRWSMELLTCEYSSMSLLRGFNAVSFGGQPGTPLAYCMFFFALVYVAVSVKLTTYAYRVAHKSKLQESKNFVDYFVLLCNCMYVAKCFVR